MCPAAEKRVRAAVAEVGRGVAEEDIMGNRFLAENAVPVFIAPNALERQAKFVELRIALEGHAGGQVLLRQLLQVLAVGVLKDVRDAVENDFPYFHCVRIRRHASSI